jgi:hypothetical protein
MILATEFRLGLTMGIVNQPVFNKELNGCWPQSGILTPKIWWPNSNFSGQSKKN